ncbi:uncharacterized protein J3R85_009668 [Psidium guajava]|nr:uncharacterized protein J3R85_009668 [Psidium guajava]
MASSPCADAWKLSFSMILMTPIVGGRDSVFAGGPKKGMMKKDSWDFLQLLPLQLATNLVWKGIYVKRNHFGSVTKLLRHRLPKMKTEIRERGEAFLPALVYRGLFHGPYREFPMLIQVNTETPSTSSHRRTPSYSSLPMAITCFSRSL